MPVVAGTSFTTTLQGPGGITSGLGARVEVPVTRAIVSAFTLATLSGGVWTVTLDAPLTPGDYEIVWRTTDPDPPRYESFVPLFVVSQASAAAVTYPDVDISTSGIRPSVDEVARLERTRTRHIDTGVDEGTFTTTTFPTEADVTGVIDDAVEFVLSAIPEQVDPEQYPQLREAVKYHAAILIETSFFRVQENTGSFKLLVLTRDAVLNNLAPSEKSRYVGLY